LKIEIKKKRKEKKKMTNVRLTLRDGNLNQDSENEIDEKNFIIRPDGIFCPVCNELVDLGFLGMTEERSKESYLRGGLFRMGEIEIECSNEKCSLSKKKVEMKISLYIK